MKNILEYLENSSLKFGDKVAAADEKNSVTYSKLEENAKKIGSYLIPLIARQRPIAVYSEKSVNALTAFMGIAYAGCFYVFISPEQPTVRVNHILEVLSPTIILTEKEYSEKLLETDYKGDVAYISDVLNTSINTNIIEERRKKALDVDPLYCNFTSGSTGIPKGVLVCHRSVIDFIDYFVPTFGITENDVIGNQAPFDFDVSVKDIYSAFKVGATIQIIPKKYFSIPMMLMDFLCEREVTTLIWAVSALCIVSQLKAMTYKVPVLVNKILFSGEAMPIKHLKIWKRYLPNALYVNLYGPTEITCNCTYYIIDREFSDEEKLPIGIPFPNEKILLLDDKDEEIDKCGITGEICVSGTALALGYYNNMEQTKKVFVQNPCNSLYPEIIYRTGDLGYYGEDGNLCFAGRKDFQIKLMGHRIELEEVEIALNAVNGVLRGCCVFDEPKNRIVAFYVGEVEVKEIQADMKKIVPVFMIPSLFKKVEDLPLNNNGKIDRKRLLMEFKK